MIHEDVDGSLIVDITKTGFIGIGGLEKGRSLLVLGGGVNGNERHESENDATKETSPRLGTALGHANELIKATNAGVAGCRNSAIGRSLAGPLCPLNTL